VWSTSAKNLPSILLIDSQFRAAREGRHYQKCLVCGTAYEYDWRMMRRNGGLPSLPTALAKSAQNLRPSQPGNQHR
jgi:hypothetical protein